MGGVRPNASENGQISPSTTVRAARGDGSCPNLASILPEGRKNANIHASSGIIRGIPVNAYIVTSGGTPPQTLIMPVTAPSGITPLDMSSGTQTIPILD